MGDVTRRVAKVECVETYSAVLKCSVGIVIGDPTEQMDVLLAVLEYLGLS